MGSAEADLNISSPTDGESGIDNGPAASAAADNHMTHMHLLVKTSSSEQSSAPPLSLSPLLLVGST